mgnify:CR=1 FL=1
MPLFAPSRGVEPRSSVSPLFQHHLHVQQESHKNPLSANRLQAVFTDSCRLHTNIINKYITYDLSIYTFIPKPCHPSRHAKPSSSSSLTPSQPSKHTHIVVIKALKLCAIQASCVKSFHLFIFSLKCSPLSWHPSLKRQPHHIHSAHIAQPSHLMSHSPSTQPQSCHNH